MKLFGGSGGRRQSKSRAKQISEEPAAARAPSRRSAAGGADRAQARGQKRRKGQKAAHPEAEAQRRIIITVAVVLALVAGVAARRPFSSARPQANDPTIKDKENGDKVDVERPAQLGHAH